MAVYVAIILLILSPLIYRVLVTSHWLWRVHKIWRACKPFAPLKPHWIKGISGDLKPPGGERLKQYVDWTERFPKCWALLQPLRPSLRVHHPDIIKKIVKYSLAKTTFPATGGQGYSMLKPWIGDSLLISSGKKWFRTRRLLTPAFHFDMLKMYLKVYNESISKTLAKFERESTSGESVEIYKMITSCTLEIILKCAFSYDEDIQNNPQRSEYVKCSTRLAELSIDRIYQPMHAFDFVYKLSSKGREFHRLCEQSHSFAMDVIASRKAFWKNINYERKNAKKIDFLDILLLAKDEHGAGLTDEEIRDEVETFMFAGHDTTASAATWILYNLAQSIDIQDQVYEEISRVLGSRDEILWNDLSEMPFLTMCIKESLRKDPPVVNFTRELLEETIIEGKVIPAGTPIDVNILGLNHNPIIWGEDHNSYNPDRFSPDLMSKMNPYAFIPFSAGPRNCIGQTFALSELKVFIARTLKQFRISLDQDHHVERIADIVMRPRYGMKMFFQKRG